MFYLEELFYVISLLVIFIFKFCNENGVYRFILINKFVIFI